jgi:hypothetical protein
MAKFGEEFPTIWVPEYYGLQNQAGRFFSILKLMTLLELNSKFVVWY